MTTDSMSFGRQISKARKAAALSQKELAASILKEEDLDIFSAHTSEMTERTVFLNDNIRDTLLESIARRRGNRLKVELEELAKGKVYSGMMAVEMGLADGISDMRTHFIREGLDGRRMRFAKKTKGKGIVRSLLGIITR